MKINEINEAINRIAYTSAMLEDEYINNGGEVTATTEQLEGEIAALRTCIEGEGVDALGRWLANKESEVANLKAEKQAIDRRIKAASETIDYIKGEVAKCLDVLGIETAKKGLIYGFKAVDKVTTHLTAESAAEWLKTAKNAVSEKGLPEWLDVSVRLLVSKLPEGETPEGVEREVSRTVRFSKPRKCAEKSEENAC